MENTDDVKQSNNSLILMTQVRSESEMTAKKFIAICKYQKKDRAIKLQNLIIY